MTVKQMVEELDFRTKKQIKDQGILFRLLNDAQHEILSGKDLGIMEEKFNFITTSGTEDYSKNLMEDVDNAGTFPLKTGSSRVEAIIDQISGVNSRAYRDYLNNYSGDNSSAFRFTETWKVDNDGCDTGKIRFSGDTLGNTVTIFYIRKPTTIDSISSSVDLPPHWHRKYLMPGATYLGWELTDPENPITAQYRDRWENLKSEFANEINQHKISAGVEGHLSWGFGGTYYS